VVFACWITVPFIGEADDVSTLDHGSPFLWRGIVVRRSTAKNNERVKSNFREIGWI
jgi:hypothetical protein